MQFVILTLDGDEMKVQIQKVFFGLILDLRKKVTKKFHPSED
jgi:hypothetical protein